MHKKVIVAEAIFTAAVLSIVLYKPSVKEPERTAEAALRLNGYISEKYIHEPVIPEPKIDDLSELTPEPSEILTDAPKTSEIAQNEPDSTEISAEVPSAVTELPIPEPEPPVSDPSYMGTFKITFYCPCSRCCGSYANGITATGTVATAGRTISVDPSVIPLGSTVVIDGQEYVAEDTGVHGNTIDVYVDSHQTALNYGVRYSDVYIKRHED